MKRRDFLIRNSMLIGGLAMFPSEYFQTPLFGREQFPSRRPVPGKRTFTSPAVEEMILKVKGAIHDPELAWMFENCFPNTLDTTVDFEMIDGKPDTFIITGDINAMWLRDSTAQIWPYMPLIATDETLKALVAGLIRRQVKCVLKDPYANAFYKDLTKESEWKSDKPSPIPGVHERKWEVDSLCYVVRLADRYYELTHDLSVFDAAWDRAMRLIVKTFRTEQRKDGTSPYSFERRGTSPIDVPPFSGTGNPVKPIGLICSMFRPSDDATIYPYLVPSNIFAMLSLRQLAAIYETVLHDHAFASECRAFADEIDHAIRAYAILPHEKFGEIYAYEVDGFGNAVFMDDANVPSLMSLAYLGAHKPTDPLYMRTRKFLLSASNPYYIKGRSAEGQASPHTGKRKIWPMGIILRAMTSTEPMEIVQSLAILKRTHAGTGFMHEAFDKDDPAQFNRAWFAWANTLFGELMIKLYHERKEVLGVIY